MNNDVLFQSDFVDEILLSMAAHHGSLIGGKIYYAPGYEFHKDRYDKKDVGKVIWYAGGKVDWAHALTYHVGVDVVDQGQFDLELRTEFITGCLMCFDKQVIDTIGYWDEKYFMYYEDADYCERAKLKNIDLIYNPSIRLWHKNAQSTSGSGSEFHIKTQEKARVRYALKYAPLRTRFHIIKNYLLNNLSSRPTTATR
jgi:GT2 family glycosyltransferase